MREWRVGVCVAALLVVPLSGAQEPSPTQQTPAPTLHIGVTAVEIDAVVTDGSGKHVSDLQASDFELLQDGKPQTISSFRYVPIRVHPGEAGAPPPPAGGKSAAPAPASAPAVPLTSGAQLRRDQAGRVMAIVIDDLNLAFNNMTRVRTALNAFLDREVRADDAIAIVTTSRGVGRLQQFTNDKAILKDTVSRLQINLLGLGAGDEEGENAALKRGETPGASRTTNEDRDAMNKGQQNEANESASEQLQSGALAAVQNVVRGMRDLPGRKSVVFVSDGFSLMTPVATGATIARPDQWMVGRPDLIQAFQRLVDEANRSFVIIHTLSTQGVFNPLEDNFSAERRGRTMTGSELTTAANTKSDKQGGLRQLAHEAGGLFLAGNDFGIGFGKAMADQEGYYVLAYQPDASTFTYKADKKAAFHRVTVRVKRSGLQARARSGFLGLTDAEAHPEPRSPEERLWNVASSPFIANDLSVRVTPIFAHRTGGDIFKVLLHLDGNGLTFAKSDDGRYRAPLEVLATLIDARGAAIEGKMFKFALQTAAEPDAAARTAGFSCNVELPAIKPGAYQLRVAARDVASNRTGTGYQFVRIPNLASTQLALSGVALQGEAASASPAERRFQAASTLHYAFAAYNAQLDPKDHRPALTLRLRLYHEGSLLVDGKPVPIDAVTTAEGPARSAEVSGELQLSPAIKPGEYQLEIEVKDTRAPGKTSTARQWIDFTIAAP
jgi:VWFA-related protein